MVFTTRVPEIFVFLCHLIYHLILIKHFRVVLLFNLDVSQEFSKTGLAEVKDVGIVLAGDQLFRSNAVCGQKSVVLLGLGICHGAVGSFGSIVPPLGVIEDCRRAPDLKTDNVLLPASEWTETGS